MSRIVIFGNSGSGKSTMARELSLRHGLPHLDLDQLAWSSPAVRKPIHESAADIQSFVDSYPEWVVEGCYVDLIELVLPNATDVRFLNPGTDVCIANCLARPWEPEKYATKESQDSMLDVLIQWVKDYESRTDEYSLARHRELFESFAGEKREYTSNASVTPEHER